MHDVRIKGLKQQIVAEKHQQCMHGLCVGCCNVKRVLRAIVHVKAHSALIGKLEDNLHCIQKCGHGGCLRRVDPLGSFNKTVLAHKADLGTPTLQKISNNGDVGIDVFA